MQDTDWMLNTLPLPVPTLPRPWEDLASLITRVSAEMGYRNPGWILHPEDIPHVIFPNRLLMLHNAKDYRLLQQLLNISEEELYGLTFHRFASQLQAPEIPHPDTLDVIQRSFIKRTTQVSFFQQHNSTKVCPRCLDGEEGYGRLYWYISYAISCPQHGIALVDQCPICHSPIPALRPLLSICPQCKKGDYRTAQIEVLPDDPFFSTGHARILCSLGIENIEKESMPSVLAGSPLLELLPWEYFQLLHAFRFILGELSTDSTFLRANSEQRTKLRSLMALQSLSNDEKAVLIATFHFIFASWPDNFFTLLETLPHQRRELLEKNILNTTGVHRDFGGLYKTWLHHRLKSPAYSFLYEAFSDFLRKRYAGGYLSKSYLLYRGRQDEPWQQPAYVPKRHAIKTLNISGGTLEKLIDQGLLRLHKKSMDKKGKRTLTLIEWSSIEELREEWEKFITFESVSNEYLGTRSTALVALMDADLLVPARGPKIDGYSQYLYRKTDVEQFVHALLLAAVKKREPSPTGINLNQTGGWLWCKLTLATTITEILCGRLIPIDLDNGRPLFQRLLLARTEMNRFRERRELWRCEELGWLTTREAAASLGVYERVLLHWMQCGLISGERRLLEMVWRVPRLIFTKESLDTFRQNYAFTEEVAVRFDVPRGTIERYVSKGILHPVVGRSTTRGGGRMLFLREEIESLIPLGSMGLRDVKTLLGVSDTQIYTLVFTQHLPCVVSSAGTRAPLRFFRSDLETYWKEQAELYQQLLTRLTAESVGGDNSWLLTRDIAAMMGVSGATVRNWINQMQWTVRKETMGAVYTYYVNKEDLATYVRALLENAKQMLMRVRIPNNMIENDSHVDG